MKWLVLLWRRCSLATGVVLIAAGAVHAQTLTVAMGLNKPPYVTEDGRAGLEIEIVRQALAAVDLNMQPLQLPPSRGLMLQRAGQLDVLLTVTENIGNTGFFSEPYVTYQNVAISLASRKLDIRKVEDLSDWTIAAFQNASIVLGERYAKAVALSPQYREFSQQVTQNNLLYSERVDVIVGDRRILQYLLREIDAKLDAKRQVVIHTIFPPSQYRAVFKDPAMRDQFNRGLKLIQSNGTYEAIVKKYNNP